MENLKQVGGGIIKEESTSKTNTTDVQRNPTTTTTASTGTKKRLILKKNEVNREILFDWKNEKTIPPMTPPIPVVQHEAQFSSTNSHNILPQPNCQQDRSLTFIGPPAGYPFPFGTIQVLVYNKSNRNQQQQPYQFEQQQGRIIQQILTKPIPIPTTKITQKVPQPSPQIHVTQIKQATQISAETNSSTQKAAGKISSPPKNKCVSKPESEIQLASNELLETADSLMNSVRIDIQMEQIKSLEVPNSIVSEFQIHVAHSPTTITNNTTSRIVTSPSACVLSNLNMSNTFPDRNGELKSEEQAIIIATTTIHGKCEETGEIKSVEEDVRVIITPEIMQYFLEKDVEFVIDEGNLSEFDADIIRFLNRETDFTIPPKKSYRSTATVAASFQNSHQFNMSRSYQSQQSNQKQSHSNFKGESYSKGTIETGFFGGKSNRSFHSAKVFSERIPFAASATTTSGNTRNQFLLIQRNQELDDDEIAKKREEISKSSVKFLSNLKSQNQEGDKQKISEIRSILNILTPTNFDKLKVELVNICMRMDSISCEYVVEGIIEKARTFEKYSAVYANLCTYIIAEEDRLSQLKQGEAESEKAVMHSQGIISSNNSSSVKNNQTRRSYRSHRFKDFLISNIQQAFYREKDVFNNRMTLAKKKSESELTNANDRFVYEFDKKTRELLNVQFIGNLFLNRSLGKTVLHICCEALFFRFLTAFQERKQINPNFLQELGDSCSESEVEEENSIEALIRLLESTGSTIQERFSCEMLETIQLKDISYNNLMDIYQNSCFKSSEHSKTSLSEQQIKLTFQDYYSILQWLQNERKVSPRIHSLISNLLERKQNNWLERRAQDSKPVMLSQLKRMHAEEMHNNHLEVYDSQIQGGFNRFQDSKPKHIINKRNDMQMISSHKTQELKGFHKRGDTSEPVQSVRLLSEVAIVNRVNSIWQQLRVDSAAICSRDKNDQVSHSIEIAVESLKQLRIESINSIDFIDIILRTSYDCNTSEMEQRIRVAVSVLEEYNASTFMNAISNRLSRLTIDWSDYPFCASILARIFFQCSEKDSEIRFDLLEIITSKKGNQDEKTLEVENNVRSDGESESYDREDIVFVFKMFAEEVIALAKKYNGSDKKELLVYVQIAGLLRTEMSDFEKWAERSFNRSMK